MLLFCVGVWRDTNVCTFSNFFNFYRILNFFFPLLPGFGQSACFLLLDSGFIVLQSTSWLFMSFVKIRVWFIFSWASYDAKRIFSESFLWNVHWVPFMSTAYIWILPRAEQKPNRCSSLPTQETAKHLFFSFARGKTRHTCFS